MTFIVMGLKFRRRILIFSAQTVDDLLLVIRKYRAREQNHFQISEYAPSWRGLDPRKDTIYTRGQKINLGFLGGLVH